MEGSRVQGFVGDIRVGGWLIAISERNQQPTVYTTKRLMRVRGFKGSRIRGWLIAISERHLTAYSLNR